MLRTLIRRFVQEERAASMVEYSLLVALIALIAFVAVQTAGDTLSGTYSEIADELVKAGS
jgi:Flp pilus assembly pilin Flp